MILQRQTNVGDEMRGGGEGSVSNHSSPLFLFDESASTACLHSVEHHDRLGPVMREVEFESAHL